MHDTVALGGSSRLTGAMMRIDRVDVIGHPRTSRDLGMVGACGGEAFVQAARVEPMALRGKFGPEITAIVIPEWLAIDKGLKQATQDDDTVDLFGGAS